MGTQQTAHSLTFEGFLNGNAGKGTEREGNAAHLANLFTASPFRSRMHVTRTREELYGAVRGIRRRKPDVIVLSSGDGGLNFALTPILKEYADVPDHDLPFILYLPSGTMRLVGASLGLNTFTPEDLAAKVLAMLQGGGRRAFGDKERLAAIGGHAPVVRSHILRIEDEQGSVEYGFLWGAGIPVNFLDLYYEGSQLGKLGASRVMFETVTDELVSLLTLSESQQLLTKPVYGMVTLQQPARLLMDRTRHTAIMASTIDQLGFGFKGMPLARSQHGKFMLRSTDLDFFQLCTMAPMLTLAIPLPGVFDAVAGGIVVNWHQLTRTTVDGEMREPHLKDIISCGPELRFLRP